MCSLIEDRLLNRFAGNIRQQLELTPTQEEPTARQQANQMTEVVN